ncbi:MAG: DsbA family protein [Gaiellaceae bacterium]
MAVLLVAGALAGILVGASQLGAAGEKADRRSASAPAAALTSSEPVAFAEPLLAGIPQQGAALGSPTAPVTLVEYADLQCPYCAEWAHETLPILVSDYVRTGKLRIVFRGLAFIGPDSETALRTALAAGDQNHLWDVVDGLYAYQGHENAGWVTEGLLDQLLAAVPGLDRERAQAERDAPWVEGEIAEAAAAAERAGVTGTPAFELGPTGGRLELAEIRSLGPEGIRPAIDALLGR